MTTSTAPAPVALVPFIPDNAPFSPSQRAWLNGFLAGVFAGGLPANTVAEPLPTPVRLKVNVYFGSESGNSEALAKRIAKAAVKRGFESKAIGLDKISPASLGDEKYALIVTSTFGEGDPPENAKAFHAALFAPGAPRLEQLQFAVCGLGDTNYEKFCECSKQFDARLEALGAKRIFERADCNVDYEAAYQRWHDGVFSVLDASAPAALPSAAPAVEVIEPAPVESGAHSRKNPFHAKLLTNLKLTGDGSAKETRHFEISLAGSGLSYEAGDALGVIPTNCPALIDEILHALNCDGEEAAPAPDGGEIPLRIALERHYEITKVPAPLLQLVAKRSADRTLRDLLDPAAREALKHYLWGRETVDVLVDFASAKISPVEFVGSLKKLQPRLYSISSSLKAHPEQVHLTVAAVRYDAFGRARKGVCSTFLADRANGSVPVFVQTSHSFRLPAAGETPIIMVGPGTGIAPFRAFLHERRATGATGGNWLFFGDQKRATDFLYREQLEGWVADKHLARLDLAFSRDQAEKIYVQNRMIEQGPELWKWLQDGAHFYVCGDASRMAKDVDAALHTVAQKCGGLTSEAAVEYVSKLKAGKRYQRDVY